MIKPVIYPYKRKRCQRYQQCDDSEKQHEFIIIREYVFYRLVGGAGNQFQWKVNAFDLPGRQAQDKKNDGCLIFVTKMPDAQKSEYPTYAKSYKKLYTGIKKKRLLYMFESSDNLYEACRQLMLAGYAGKSDIFADEEKYYLYIEDNREQCLDMISEYGFLMNNPFFSFYLDEHAKKIITASAVQTFAGIFN